MAPDLYLDHWTLDTGHRRRRSLRSEVSDLTIAALHEILALTLAGREPEIMPECGATMRAEIAGAGALLATVSIDSDALVTFGIAAEKKNTFPLFSAVSMTSALPVLRRRLRIARHPPQRPGYSLGWNPVSPAIWAKPSGLPISSDASHGLGSSGSKVCKGGSRYVGR